jgi:hypothetical protein
LIKNFNVEEKLSALKENIHPTLQNMKILYCFLYLWFFFALLDPDLDPDSEYGSVSTDPIESGSYSDPEPCG